MEDLGLVMQDITLEDDADLKEYLRNTSVAGLVHCGLPADFSTDGSGSSNEDEGEQAGAVAEGSGRPASGGDSGSEPGSSGAGGSSDSAAKGADSRVPRVVVIRSWDMLQTGHLYEPAGSGRFQFLSSMRAYCPRQVQSEEAQIGRALLAYVQHQDPGQPCFVDDSTRVLPAKSKHGRHEIELDAVVNCPDRAYIVSHKTWANSPKPVTKLLEQVAQIKEKSKSEVYKDTKYAMFYAAQTTVRRKASVMRGFRNGNNIKFAMHLKSALLPKLM